MHSRGGRARCSVAAETFRVIVACAEADRQTVLAVEVRAGTTAWEAIEQSGILARHPGLAPGDCGVGIFGREVARGRVLAAGDRVEVLRPLPEDPRTRRRRLARAGRSMSARSAGGG
jgi:putative ubiquitin-RnfH superfamily antitoxin RatB of RatAB toxin-antitoxin module